MHLNLNCEDKISAVEELTDRLLGVELSRDVYTDLLCYFLHLLDPRILNQPISTGSAQHAWVITSCDGQRVFVVFEDQAYDAIDGVDGFVDFVSFQNAVLLIGPLMEYVHARLH